MVIFKAKRTSVRHQLLPRPAVVLFCFPCTTAQYVYAPSSPSSFLLLSLAPIFGGRPERRLPRGRGRRLLDAKRSDSPRKIKSTFRMLILKH